MQDQLKTLRDFFKLPIPHSPQDLGEHITEQRKAIAALTKLEAMVGEPVAELRADMKGGGFVHWLSDDVFDIGTKLYTAAPVAQQPQAETVPSSDLNPDEGDPVTLWAEIWRLREAVKGPDGYATWQDAATAERIRRVRAESKHAAPPAQQYEAGDVASASAQGFRDGGASVTQQEPVAWAMPKGDGTFIDVITPAEHARDEGSYTVPLFAHPVAQQPQAEPRQSDIFCGVDFADGVLAVSVLRRRPDDVAELLHSEQIELPVSAAPQQAEAVPPDVVRDAERYRYLRSHCLCAGHGSITVFLDDRHGTGNRAKPLHLEEIDEAIDAAIAQQKD